MFHLILKNNKILQTKLILDYLKPFTIFVVNVAQRHERTQEPLLQIPWRIFNKNFSV